MTDFQHGVIDHAMAYVDGEIHTNGLETFWSLLKSGLKGTYISGEPFHLFRYLDEQAWRNNNRKMTDADRSTLPSGALLGNGSHMINSREKRWQRTREPFPNENRHEGSAGLLLTTRDDRRYRQAQDAIRNSKRGQRSNRNDQSAASRSD